MKPLPIMSSEQPIPLGLSYRASTDPSKRLAVRYVATGTNPGVLTFRSTLDSVGDGTSMGISTFVKGSVAQLLPFDGASAARVTITERAPMAPVLTIESPTPIPARVPLVRLESRFTGVWPVSAHLNLTRNVAEEVRQAIEPFEELLLASAAVRLLTNVLNASLLDGALTIAVAEGGEVGKATGIDYLVDTLLRTAFEPIAGRIQLSVPSALGPRDLDVDVDTERLFLRRLIFSL